MDMVRQPILKLEKVTLPGPMQIRLTIAKGQRLGVALDTPEQRKALVRKILGFESPLDGVTYPEGPIANFSGISKALVRSHVGTNLPARDLLDAGAKAQKKIESAKTLLEAFEIHMKQLLSAIKDVERADAFARPRARFLRWSANFGLRHANMPAKLNPAEWTCFWLTVAMAAGAKLIVLVDPLAGLDLMGTMRVTDVLRLFQKQEEAAWLMLAESSKAPGAQLCEHWIEKAPPANPVTAPS